MENLETQRRGVITAIIATALILVPSTVWAVHSFTDVPDENVFHEDIEWLKDAGVTIGCNPPDNTLFCPQDNVTREQMAAFMRRLAENQVVDAGTVEGFDAAALISGSAPPAGVTVRGSYVIDFDDAGQRESTAISYGLTLDGQPIAHFVVRGDDPIAECPGTADNPLAQPGHLCVYESDSENVTGHCVAATVPFYDCGEADAYGAGLSVESTPVITPSGAELYFSVGTWALTTPEPGTLTPAALDGERPESPYSD